MDINNIGSIASILSLVISIGAIIFAKKAINEVTHFKAIIKDSSNTTKTTQKGNTAGGDIVERDKKS